MSPKAQLLEVVWLGMSTGLLGTSQSLLSSAYICQASVACLRLFRQTMARAFCFARARAGNNKPARIAMMAMTTSSSMRVNPPLTPPGRGTRLGRRRPLCRLLSMANSFSKNSTIPASGSGRLLARRYSGTGVPPVCSRPETHGRDAPCH